MLAAEHYAVEYEGVRELLEIRTREVQHMVDHFGAVGTQSALLAGFVVTSLTAIVGDVITDPEHVAAWARYTFWISSALSLACCLHAMCLSTFAAVWGPGLALRGVQGSVGRAFFEMRRAMPQVGTAYVSALALFLIQSAAVFFILDGVPTVSAPAAISVALLGVGVAVTSRAMFAMRRCMHVDAAWSSSAATEIKHNFGREDRTLFRHDTPPDLGSPKAINASKTELANNARTPLLAADSVLRAAAQQQQRQELEDVAAAAATEDANAGANANANANDDEEEEKAADKPADKPATGKAKAKRHRPVHLRLRRGRPSFRYEGYLEKRGHRTGAVADARLLPGWAVHWKRRYVVLRGQFLHWFPSQEDYLRAKEQVRRGKGGGGGGGGYEAYGGVTLSLKGYEVLVIAQRETKDGENDGGGSSDDEPDWEFMIAPLDRRASKRQQKGGGGGGFFSKLFGGGAKGPGKRVVKVRHFRAASEAELHGWVKALAASSIISQS